MRLKSILAVLVFAAIVLFTAKWIQKWQVKQSALTNFTRLIKDTIDIKKYSWRHLPNNVVGITSGRLSYIMTSYNASQQNGQGFTEVLCLPVENEQDLLAAASFTSERQYVYRSNKTWFRKNKKTNQVYSTPLPISRPISALILDSNQLLLAGADTVHKTLNLVIIDSMGAILEHFNPKVTTNAFNALAKGALILHIDSSYYLIARYTPIVVALNRVSGQLRYYNLLSNKRHDYAKDEHGQMLQCQVHYYFDSACFYILNTVPDKAAPEQPLFYTSYLDFYNKAFKYQYSIAIKNINPADLSDIILINQQFYLTSGRDYMSGYL